ncbi:MAG: hypothetical protein AAF762_11565 [Pseudomonadota bacterium]
MSDNDDRNLKVQTMTTNDASKRIIVSARVSEDSANGWHDFCNNNGVSLSALLEAAGLQLAEETFPPSVDARQRMVEHAREIDIARRSRRKA